MFTLDCSKATKSETYRGNILKNVCLNTIPDTVIKTNVNDMRNNVIIFSFFISFKISPPRKWQVYQPSLLKSVYDKEKNVNHLFGHCLKKMSVFCNNLLTSTTVFDTLCSNEGVVNEQRIIL